MTDAVQERALRLKREQQLRVAATREQQLQLKIRRLQQQDGERVQLLEQTRSLLQHLQQQHPQIRATALELARQIGLAQHERAHQQQAATDLGCGAASVFMAASGRLEMGDAGWMSAEHRAAHVGSVSSEHHAQMSRLMSAECPSQVDWDYVDAHQAVLSTEQRDWTYVLCQLTPAESQRAQRSTGARGRRRVRGRRGGRRVRGAHAQCSAAPQAVQPQSDSFSSSLDSPFDGGPLPEPEPPCSRDEPAPIPWDDGADDSVGPPAATQSESIGARVRARHTAARTAAVAMAEAMPTSPIVIQHAEPHRSSSDFQLLGRAFASVEGALCCPRTAVRDHATVLVAMGEAAADSVLGSVSCVARPAATDVSGVWPRHMWVHRLWVREDRRSQGIGSQLLVAAEDLAAARGLPLLRLAVDSENDTARQLYERLGYRVDGAACLRAQTNSIFMSKKLRCEFDLMG